MSVTGYYTEDEPLILLSSKLECWKLQLLKNSQFIILLGAITNIIAVQAERSQGSKRVIEIEFTSSADTLITTSLIIDPNVLGEIPAFLINIFT